MRNRPAAKPITTHPNLQRARPGGYAGPVLHGRFQVVSSGMKGLYIIADLEDDANPVLEDVKSDGSMHPVARYDSIEAAETAAAMLVRTAPGKARHTPKLAPVLAARSIRPPSKPTAASKVRDLLKAKPGASDAEICAEVNTDFPTFKVGLVTYYRRELQEKGLLPKS